MARSCSESRLKHAPRSRVHFDVAARDDDADIRRLLRSNPMPGLISLSLEREPDYFADHDLPGEETQTVVARENGRLLCAGSCVVRQRFVNGRPRRVGYLGGLRLDAAAAGRFDVLRRGYQFFQELQQAAPADFYFTSIAEENARARSVLERALPGMPRYEFVMRFVTLVLSVRRKTNIRMRPGTARLTAELTDVLNRGGQRRQFAPCWSEEWLRGLAPLGLQPGDFVTARQSAGATGCAALWDQRRFKQVVVRGYSRWLARSRTLLNWGTRLVGRPGLPSPGYPLAIAFCSHLASTDGDPALAAKLISNVQTLAASRGVEWLVVGFAANDPCLDVVRRSFPWREYHTRIYVVSWPGLGGTVGELDDRVWAPEGALL